MITDTAEQKLQYRVEIIVRLVLLLCNTVNQSSRRDEVCIIIEPSNHSCDMLTFYSTLLVPNTALYHSLVCMLECPLCPPVAHMQLQNLSDSEANPFVLNRYKIS